MSFLSKRNLFTKFHLNLSTDVFGSTAKSVYRCPNVQVEYTYDLNLCILKRYIGHEYLNIQAMEQDTHIRIQKLFIHIHKLCIPSDVYLPVYTFSQRKHTIFQKKVKNARNVRAPYKIFIEKNVLIWSQNSTNISYYKKNDSRRAQWI